MSPNVLSSLDHPPTRLAHTHQPTPTHRGLFEMGEYAFLAVYRSSYGMSLADLRAKGNGMLEAWLILAVEWVVFMVLAWYLEQVRAGSREQQAAAQGRRRKTPKLFVCIHANKLA